jgi:hypothetical protein
VIEERDRRDFGLYGVEWDQAPVRMSFSCGPRAIGPSTYPISMHRSRHMRAPWPHGLGGEPVNTLRETIGEPAVRLHLGSYGPEVLAWR